MNWMFLIISVLVASFNSVLLHKLPAKSNLFVFNMIGAGVWILLLLAVNGFALTLTPATVLWGILYGVVQELFMFFKAQAMKNGSVSVTTLIGNCSLVLSTGVGVIVWAEAISLWQVLGIALLLVAFFLCTYKKSESTRQATKNWLIYCLFFFSFAAGVGIIFKAFSKAGGSGSGDMMIVAAITMLVFAGIKLLVVLRSKKAEKASFSKSFVVLALVCGLLSCGYNRLNITLAGLFDSAVFYPCFNGGVILASALLSMLILRERLTKRQTVGLALGICAVAIVGIF